MPGISRIGRVIVPVADQERAVAFYVEKLGFAVTTDVLYGHGDRWVEVTPAAGGAALALVPSRDDYPTGRETGVALESPDPLADHTALKAAGVDVDAELIGGDGVVPLMFSFRDDDGNQFTIAASDT